MPPLWLARLEAGFAGRVVDEYDQPLAGAIVVAIHARPGGAPWTNAAGTADDRARRRSVPLSTARPAATTRTEADGRFSLPVLPPGRYVLVALYLGPPLALGDRLVVDGGFLAAPLRLVVASERPALL